MCKISFRDEMILVNFNCLVAFNKGECLKYLVIAKKSGEECFEKEERFTDSNDWNIAGIVCSFHYILPFFLSLLIWEVLQIGKECDFNSLINLPLPFVTKVYKFMCDMELFKIYTRARDDKEAEAEYEKDKRKTMEKIDAYENIVNLSLIVEASVEASFQFFFQTVYVLPTIILSFTDVSGSFDWTDLFNWKTFSILLSFASFAWAFYTIR